MQQQTYTWYPPAEASMPFSAITRALPAGPNDFERDIQDFLKIKHCRLFSSGRAGLHRLLAALKQDAGVGRDQVLIPGFTCYSVPASIVKTGLEISCYDLDPQTFNPDMKSVRVLAGKRTLAIVGQHLFGIPTPMDGLMEVAESSGTVLIEDAAQALGGTYEGKALGTLGDFAILSFGRGKPLPLGKGGALIGNYDVIEKIESDHSHNGFSALAMTALNNALSGKRCYGLLELLPLGLGKTIFDPGFAVQSMPDILKRLGKIAFKEMQHLHAHRREIANVYRETIGAMRSPLVPRKSTPVFTRYPVLAGIKHIPKSLYQMGVRPGYPHAILEEPTIRPHCSQNPASTQGAIEISKTLITLPTHSGITRETAKQVAKKVLRPAT